MSKSEFYGEKKQYQKVIMIHSGEMGVRAWIQMAQYEHNIQRDLNQSILMNTNKSIDWLIDLWMGGGTIGLSPDPPSRMCRVTQLTLESVRECCVRPHRTQEWTECHRSDSLQSSTVTLIYYNLQYTYSNAIVIIHFKSYYIRCCNCVGMCHVYPGSQLIIPNVAFANAAKSQRIRLFCGTGCD